MSMYLLSLYQKTCCGLIFCLDDNMQTGGNCCDLLRPLYFNLCMIHKEKVMSYELVCMHYSSRLNIDGDSCAHADIAYDYIYELKLVHGH